MLYLRLGIRFSNAKNYTPTLTKCKQTLEKFIRKLKRKGKKKGKQLLLLRRIFEPKKNESTGDWGKLHNEELHNLYSSSNFIRMIKSRGMGCAGRVARIGRRMHIGY
jgi:hypothetical protein